VSREVPGVDDSTRQPKARFILRHYGGGARKFLSRSVFFFLFGAGHHHTTDHKLGISTEMHIFKQHNKNKMYA